MSATWTDGELRRVGAATEVQIATLRDDGSQRPYVTIWTVRTGDHLNVRSAYGADNPWFRRATASGSGRIRAGGIERDVTFTPSANPTQPHRRLSTPPTTPNTTATARRSSEPSPARTPRP